MKETKIVQFGVGPIGATLVEYALRKKGIKLVGAVDIDKNKVGKDLGELTVGKHLGLQITNNADRLLARVRPDVVLHSTGSYLKDVMPQLVKIMDAGADVISTCEELAYPFLKHPDISKQLDKRAQEWCNRFRNWGKPRICHGLLSHHEYWGLPRGEEDPIKQNTGRIASKGSFSEKDRGWFVA